VPDRQDGLGPGLHPLYNVLDTWKESASNVPGRSLPGGHYLPEEAPQAVLTELRMFLRRNAELKAAASMKAQMTLAICVERKSF